MREKVAVATVQGKAYFLVVNALREQNVAFTSLVPGQSVPPRVKLVITTEEEKAKVNHERVLVFHSEEELETLMLEVKKLLLGKETFERIIVGIDPGQAIGLVVVADGKVIEQGNCYSSHEIINGILKILRTVNFSVTRVSIKIGNGVPVYKELLQDLDDSMPPQVSLEVVNEAGTNYPLKLHSRKIRHISSAIRIAGRTGRVFERRKAIATDSTTQ
jgi:hypothetical protein